jgi:hypothetical protein
MKRSWNLCAVALTCSLTMVGQSLALSRFVSPTGSVTPPYTNLTMAARDIQTALNAAQADDTVWVGAGTYLLTNEIVINKRINLRSIFPRTAIIDGQQQVPVILVSTNATNTTINGFVVKNGRTWTSSGGITAEAGCTIINCLVVSNWAEAASGGGICLRKGSSMVQNCTIAHNKANFLGGGVYSDINGTGLIDHCDVRGNISLASSGGGVHLDRGTISNCWISDNVAVSAGGLSVENGTVVNTVIENNREIMWVGTSGRGYTHVLWGAPWYRIQADASTGGMNGHFSTGGCNTLSHEISIVYINTTNGNTR